MKAYLDNNRASKIDVQVMELMQQSLVEHYADPRARHSDAIKSRTPLAQAYEKIKASIHAKDNDMVTIGSSVDELHCRLLISIYVNSVITGQKNQIILSASESDTVIEVAEYIASQGCRITILPLNSDGVVDTDMLKQTITTKTALVSITMVDAQSGAIMAIDEASQICSEHGVPLHSDASHAIGKLPIDVQMLDIDYLTLSSETVHGPTGVAMMHIKEGIKLPNLIQPSNNLVGIVGLGKALELAVDSQAFEMEDTRELRDALEESIREIEDHLIITPWALRTPNTLLAGFKDVSSDALVWELNRYGISVSGEKGRALTENTAADSIYKHTLVEFALSRYTSQEEMDYTIEKLKKSVEIIRTERAR